MEELQSVPNGPPPFGEWALTLREQERSPVNSLPPSSLQAPAAASWRNTLERKFSQNSSKKLMFPLTC